MQYVELGDQRTQCFGNLNLCPNGLSLAFWINVHSTPLTANYVVSWGAQSSSSHGAAVSFKMGSSRIQLTGDFTTDTMIWSLEDNGPSFTGKGLQ